MKDVFQIYNFRIEHFKRNGSFEDFTIYFFNKCENCNSNDIKHLDLIDTKDKNIDHYFYNGNQMFYYCNICSGKMKIEKRCLTFPTKNNEDNQLWIYGNSNKVKNSYQYKEIIHNTTKKNTSINIDNKYNTNMINMLFDSYKDGLININNNNIRNSIEFSIGGEYNENLEINLKKESILDDEDTILFIHDYIYSHWSLNSLDLLGFNRIVFLFTDDKSFLDYVISNLYKSKFLVDNIV